MLFYFEGLPSYKILLSYVDWCKSCIRQKLERPPFWNGRSCVIKNHGVEVTFSSMVSIMNFISLLIGSKFITDETDRRTNRQNGDLVSLTFLRKY
jgi:hypothetical protein